MAGRAVGGVGLAKHVQPVAKMARGEQLQFLARRARQQRLAREGAVEDGSEQRWRAERAVCDALQPYVETCNRQLLRSQRCAPTFACSVTSDAAPGHDLLVPPVGQGSREPSGLL